MVDSKYGDVRLFRSPDEPAALSGGFAPCGCRSEATSQWFVIVTAYQAERAVERTVRALGMPTWLGQHEDTAHHRTLLFPRYLLFQANLATDRWRDLYTKPGVETLLGTRGERPTPLRPHALNGLFQECAMDGVIYQDRKPRGRASLEGAEVEMAAGAFRGWRAICHWSSEHRVGVLLSMMGSEVTVTVPREHVRVVESKC